MLRKIFTSFLLALHNIRLHFFRTLLSVLGIVIGVGALVSILSLIDGMERYARAELAQTTSLSAILVKSNTVHTLNGIQIRKDSFPIIRYSDFMALTLLHEADVFLRSSANQVITVNDSTLGAQVHATGSRLAPGITVLHGDLFTLRDLEDKKTIAIINESFAKKAWPDTSLGDHIGKTIVIGKRSLTISAIVSDGKAASPQVAMPITLLSKAELLSSPPELILDAKKVEEVPLLKEELRKFLSDRFPSAKDDFSILSNEFRVEQAVKAFQLFRIIMGLIVGISVVVGGVGVMNVLLISVTERTHEIGIRKAVGAKRFDIMLQFLSESVAISAFGCGVGLVFGILTTMAIIPIIKALTEVPFQAAYTLNTLLVIVLVALVIGIVFGTYPAVRASRLDPVEAIRRE